MQNSGKLGLSPAAAHYYYPFSEIGKLFLHQIGAIVDRFYVLDAGQQGHPKFGIAFAIEIAYA